MNLEIKNASYAYPNSKALYSKINATVSEGEILAILGPNGCGKTTLLKCMMNLLKFSEGESLIDGIDVKKRKDLWNIVSYVPQAKNVTSSLSGLDMVLLGCAPHLALNASPKEQEIEMSKSALNRLNVSYLADKICNEMSGGELQMILIARAIVSNPQILVLDEPESNLDFKNQLMVLETLRTLTKKDKLICVINTHYPDHALNISNKVLMIDKEKGCGLFGDTEELITKENLKMIFGVEVIVETINHLGQDIKVVVPFHEVVFE